jgi:hypothetical protein
MYLGGLKDLPRWGARCTEDQSKRGDLYRQIPKAREGGNLGRTIRGSGPQRGIEERVSDGVVDEISPRLEASPHKVRDFWGKAPGSLKLVRRGT